MGHLSISAHKESCIYFFLPCLTLKDRQPTRKKIILDSVLKSTKGESISHLTKNYMSQNPLKYNFKYVNFPSARWMVMMIIALLLDGNSEIGAHVKSNLCYLICSRHLICSRADTKRIFIRKPLLSFVRTQHVLSYHLI